MYKPYLGTYLDVSHSVIVEIRAGREPFSAHAALVWLFAAVNSPVSVQRARSRETFVAHGAHVGFFACNIIYYDQKLLENNRFHVTRLRKCRMIFFFFQNDFYRV